MPKLGRGQQYGSFEPGWTNVPQVAEDITPRVEIVRQAEVFFAHPLNRALIVLVVFAVIGLLTIVVDHTSVPAVQQKAETVERSETTRAVDGRASPKGTVGCEAEVGLKGSKLTMYHVAAPWETIVLHKWDVPLDMADRRLSRSKDMSMEVEQRVLASLKEARTLAAGVVPFGSVKVLPDARGAAPEVLRALQRGIEQAMQKAGIDFCENWRSGECHEKRNENRNEKRDEKREEEWDVLDGLDKEMQKWFQSSISEVESWKKSALRHSDEIKKGAEKVREEAQHGLKKAKEEAKEEYEKAKEAVEGATQRLRKGKDKVSRREAENIVEKAEHDLEKRLRRAEEDYERLIRKGEKDFEHLERKAEDLLKEAEKEAKSIDREAEGKLRKLKDKAEKMCNKKCKSKMEEHKKKPEPKPAPAPATPPSVVPPVAEPLPPVVGPSTPKAKEEKKGKDKDRTAAKDHGPEEDDDENDDEPKPVKPKKQQDSASSTARPALKLPSQKIRRVVDEDDEE